MVKILVNDGIEPIGKEMLEAAGFSVDTQKIPQEELISRLQTYDAICVRSATKVRKEIIDACPNLKAIARGGVGMDNIDVEYARSRGIHVINTPAASSRSVAELCFAHMLGLIRFLHISNREMPVEGKTGFEVLKKKFASGTELYGKTLGIIGLGRIGREMASMGLGLGMDVLAHDPMVTQAEINFGPDKHRSKMIIDSTSLQDLLINSDFISIHVPSLGKALITMAELKEMKNDAILINASRGGIIDEQNLLEALDKGIIRGAGLDVFAGEPMPNEVLLNHPKISVSPHTGASTIEAQNNVGKELAEQLINILK